MGFMRGHAKVGGRKGGQPNKATKNLKEMILGALEAKDGQRYLEKVAENDPRTFCALLARVLPLTIAGDAAQPLRYEVVLTFGQSQDDVPAQFSGATPDDKALVHMPCP
jgi:hypothetical protein